jgi:Fe-S-cluster containining protein
LPEDLEMIHGAKFNPFLDWHHQAASFRQFILTNLLASPGALVMKDGRVFRIRTLVPARNDSGWCRFFDGSLCTIHQVSPFGCAFFDSHQGQSHSNAISAMGLQIIAGLWEDQPRSLYCQVWKELYRKGMRAPAPEECRERMGAALK